MSIASEIARIQAAKADIGAAIEEKGVKVPEGARLDAFAQLVASIQAGGGMENVEVEWVEFSVQKYIDGYLRIDVGVGIIDFAARQISCIAR